jgi:hypothetical protein
MIAIYFMHYNFADSPKFARDAREGSWYQFVLTKTPRASLFGWKSPLKFQTDTPPA